MALIVSCSFIVIPFFLEILEYIETKLLCNGKPSSSIIALQNEEFRLAGELMVMSTLQNGPAPALLNQAVFNFISNQKLAIEDIPEPGYKTVALQVCKTKKLCILNYFYLIS